MQTAEKVYFGVDIGGTKVAAGLVDAQGRIVHQARAPMNANGSAEDGLQSVRAAIDSLLSAPGAASARKIGIISPGPLDPYRGVILNPPNLPCWCDFPLADRVSATYGMPVLVENDANAAALAEALWGAGKGYKYLFYTCIGTGIGTGWIVDGHIYNGRTGAATEGGHMSIDFRGPRCGCGKPGCIEALASGTAVGARARAALERTPSSLMRELANGNAQGVTAETAVAAWRAGDATAEAVLRETADLLTVWLGNMIDLLEPEAIVVGGGMGPVVAEWFPYIREHLMDWAVNKRCREVPLLAAHYGADSGIAGAAALCLPEG
jgi:glucokinase